MPKDYYLILGVSKEAELHEIKQAYRRIAKKYHPDISGSSESSDKFLEIKEAYETLIDEDKRRRYNQEMDTGSSSRGSGFAGKQDRDVWFEREDPGTYATGWAESFFERMASGMNLRARSRGGQDAVCYEAVLSSEEARRGGRFTLTLPVQEACWMCSGRGALALGGCPLCLGSGAAVVEKRFTFRLPPNLRHGSRVKYPLRDARGSEKNLILLIRIDHRL